MNKSVAAAEVSNADYRVVLLSPVVLMKVVGATDAWLSSWGGAPASSWIERPRLSWPSMHKSHVLQI